MGEAQTCAIPSRKIQDNLHLIRYTIEQVDKISDIVGTLGKLDLSKAFKRVAQWYLAVVLQVVGLGLTFSRCINAIYRNINSVVQVNGLFLKPFMIEPFSLPGLSPVPTSVCISS